METSTAQSLQAYASIALPFLTAATLGVLIWYTVETYRLRKSAQNQNVVSANLLTEARLQTEQALMPVLALAHGRTKMEGVSGANEMHIPVIRNFGPGPAFNIQTRPLESAATSITFQHPYSLAPGEEQPITIKMKRQGQTIPIKTMYDLRSAFQQVSKPLELSTITTFTSASGQSYQTRQTFAIDAESNHFLIQFGECQRLV
jgi:hypothetical protein